MRIKMTSFLLFRNSKGEVVGVLMRPLSKKFWRITTSKEAVEVYGDYEKFRNNWDVKRLWRQYNLDGCIKEEYKSPKGFTGLMEAEDGTLLFVTRNRQSCTVNGVTVCWRKLSIGETPSSMEEHCIYEATRGIKIRRRYYCGQCELL